MSEFDKLPFHTRRVIERCRSGERLCIQHRVKDTGEPEVLAYFEPSGKGTGAKSALNAISTEFMIPMGDGLFGDASSQTWRAA